jgi:hypothetical protein
MLRGMRTPGRSAVVVAILVIVIGAGAAWYALFLPGNFPEGPVGVATAAGPMSIWPESPIDPPDALLRAQRRADAGLDAWRTDADAVVERFATNVLGWERIRERDVAGDPQQGSEVHEIRPDCADEDCLPAEPWIEVALGRLGTRAPGGVWSVVAVTSPNLDLPVEAGDTVAAGDDLAVRLRLGGDRHAALGMRYVGPTGGEPPLDCDDGLEVRSAVTGAEASVRVPDPLFDDDRCAPFGTAGYVFAYATPRLTVQTGDPLLEAAAISDLSIVPVSFGGVSVTSPTAPA